MVVCVRLCMCIYVLIFVCICMCVCACMFACICVYACGLSANECINQVSYVHHHSYIVVFNVML